MIRTSLGRRIDFAAILGIFAKYAALDGKTVFYEAGATSATLRAATAAEVAAAKKAPDVVYVGDSGG